VSRTRKSPLAIGALVAAIAIVLASCGGSSKSGSGGTAAIQPTKEGGAITVGAEEELSSFNTNTSADNSLWGAMISRLIWPQYYYQTPDFKLATGFIAAAPAQVINQKPFTVKWTINPKAVWSDGVPVTSDDLYYFWQSCNNKVDPGEPVNKDGSTAVDCVSPDGYDKITKFTKVDAKTAEAVFSEPVAEYQTLFSTPMPPAHIARAKGQDAWAKAFVSSPIVSAGPYMLKSYTKGESLTLEKNPHFWGTPAHLDTITFRFFQKSSQIPEALANNEVDVIYPTTPQIDTIANVDKISDVTSTTTFGPQWEHLTFNLANSILADVNVRKAIILGIDRQRIVDTLMKPFSDKATVLNNHVYVNNQAEYQNNAGDLEHQNVAQAKQLLDQAGWTVPAGGTIREKGGKKLSLRIITTGGNTTRENTEKEVQSELKDIGIDLKIDNRPGNDAFSVIFPAPGGPSTAGDWDIALFAWIGGVAPAIGTAPTYETGAGNNPGGYSNKQVDALFAQAEQEVDTTKRVEDLNQIDKLLWADPPDVPLYQTPTFLAFNTKFVNISENTTTEGFTWDAEKWGLKP